MNQIILMMSQLNQFMRVFIERPFSFLKLSPSEHFNFFDFSFYDPAFIQEFECYVK